MSNTNEPIYTPPTPISPHTINRAPLTGISLALKKATNDRIQSADELFERLFLAEKALEMIHISGPEGCSKSPELEKQASSPGSEQINKKEPKSSQKDHTEESNNPETNTKIVPYIHAPPPIMKPISEIFPDMDLKRIDGLKDFLIPTWPNDANYFPNVPKIDPHYSLSDGPAPADLIISMITGENIMVTGPTGSGKTSMTEQIAARTGRPFYRINFDGDVRRPELIGHHMQRTTENGSYITWQPGILQNALAHPSIIAFDEYDRGDPDLIYAIHEFLEGRDLRIPEEGDMVIKRHPLIRVVATANTKGTGDGNGLYADETRQSEASRNRFGYWTTHNYIKKEEEIELLTRHYPDVPRRTIEDICKIAESLRNNFIVGDITTSCSTRQTLRMAADMSLFYKNAPAETISALGPQWFSKAIDRVLIGRATSKDEEQKMKTMISNCIANH